MRAWPARGPAVPVPVLAVAAGGVRRAVRDGGHVVEADYLWLPARPEQLRPPAVQQAGAAECRRAAGIHLGQPPLPDLLPGLRGRRRAVPAGGHHLDGVAGRAGGADAGCVGRSVRPAAGLRNAVPEPAGDAADPADPDEGAHAGDHLRRDRAAAGLHRAAAGRGALRAPGRDAVWLAADQLLARQAAFQPQWVAGAAVLGLSAFGSNRATAESRSRAFAP